MVAMNAFPYSQRSMSLFIAHSSQSLSVDHFPTDNLVFKRNSKYKCPLNEKFEYMAVT